MRVRIPDGTRWGLLFRPLGLAVAGLILVTLVISAGTFVFYYVRYSRLIDERLSGPVFPNVSQIYAAPEKLRLGERITRYDVATQLRLAGFSETQDDDAENSDSKGRFNLTRNGIQIMPGPGSYFAQEPATLEFSEGTLVSIVGGKDQFARNEYLLEPILITNLFDQSREKRRLVKFQDLPQNLVSAVLAIEDRRFFDHGGLDYLRLMKAIYVDLTTGKLQQGASTITQQLARSLFLTPDKTIRRKLAEAMVSKQLESRLSKEEIFEHYCNTVYLGYRGSFSIVGMGEASQAYFGKPVTDLKLHEAAMLAGIIQSPNRYSPYRNPDLVLRRRKVVLDSMLAINAITQKQYDDAVALPLGVRPTPEVGGEAPHFVDMVKRRLLDRFSEEELNSQSYRVYTTLDLRLQHEADEAVKVGMAEIDKRLAAIRTKRGAKAQPSVPVEDEGAARPEVALVALDPQTGEIKALIGGRNYGMSQLNRALATRQPGSIFKPFVYATALTAHQQGTVEQPLTPMSLVLDEPTTFEFNQKPYQPANYGRDYYGEVTLRYALMKSLNVATVKVAEAVGFENVVRLARKAGLNNRIQPTPAVALGAYEVTPLEIAGAYSIFANRGVRLDPFFLSMVRSKDGALLDVSYPRKTPVLDPSVAYVITSMLESVINHGTGAGARARGFTSPAAGKTGSLSDGWFAGYTSNLLTVVWVGYDDNRDLRLTGGAAALPIWTEFMKRAVKLPLYSNVRAVAPPDSPPDGAVVVSIDPASGELATPNCPNPFTEFFIKGTEPTRFCHLHARQEQLASAPPPPPPAQVVENGVALSPGSSPVPVAVAAPPPITVPASPPPEPEKPPKKKSFWRRIFGG